MINDMPEQPKTTQLPAADKNEILLHELKALMVGGFNAVNIRLDGLEGTERTLSDAVSRMAIDVQDLRAADRRHEDDMRRLSERTKGTAANASSADLAHESRLAQEIVARQSTDAKLDALTESQAVQLAVLGRLDKFAANPNIKIILAVLATAMASWLTSKGLGK